MIYQKNDLVYAYTDVWKTNGKESICLLKIISRVSNGLYNVQVLDTNTADTKIFINKNFNWLSEFFISKFNATIPIDTLCNIINI